MKYWFVLVKLLFACITCISIDAQESIHQSKIDSVLSELSTDLKPRIRIAKQLKLVSFYKYSHPSVDSLIEVSLSIAEDENLYFFIARSLKFRARYSLYLNKDPLTIIADIERIENISQNLNNKLLPTWVATLYAEYYIRVGELNKADIYIDSLSANIKNNPNSDKGSFHTIKGMYALKNKNYSIAISEFNLALTNKNPGKTFIYNDLATLYLELLDPNKATEFANKSIEFGNKEKNLLTKIESLNILGEAHLLQRDTAAAILSFNQAEELRSIPYLSKNHSSLHKLIDIYSLLDPPKADKLLGNISSYQMVDSYAKLLVQRGRNYLKRNNLKLAYKDCEKALNDANNRKKYAFASAACDCLIEINKIHKNTPKEAYYLTKKIEFQSKLQDEKRLISLARNLSSYETEKEKALLNQAYEKDLVIINERISKYKIAGLLGFIILVLGALALYLLRKKNLKIKNQNKVILKALNEKDILLREIHHRVKNNLQLVSSILTLQSRSLNNEMAAQAIKEGKNRIRSMELIHHNLYNKESITGVSVQEYLSKLISELFSTYNINPHKIKLISQIDNLDLDIDTLVPLGLIINELFSNCLKYAFPNNKNGSVSISLREVNSKLELVIKDDGIGYDSTQIKENSFGTTLIAALTEQLDGEMIADTKNGTTVKILFSDFKIV